MIKYISSLVCAGVVSIFVRVRLPPTSQGHSLGPPWLLGFVRKDLALSGPFPVGCHLGGLGWC